MVRIMGKRTELIKHIRQLDDNNVDRLYDIAMQTTGKRDNYKPQNLLEFFGVFNWNIDSVAYQREMRDEWD